MLIVFWTIVPNEEDTTAYSPPTASSSPSPLLVIVYPRASDQNSDRSSELSYYPPQIQEMDRLLPGLQPAEMPEEHSSEELMP